VKPWISGKRKGHPEKIMKGGAGVLNLQKLQKQMSFLGKKRVQQILTDQKNSKGKTPEHLFSADRKTGRWLIVSKARKIQKTVNRIY